jgi:hypothetical protein
MADLVLPAFEMDCRDWIVLSPGDAGVPEEVGGSPRLAVLSTVVIEDDLREATGALTIGLLDGEDLNTRAVAPGSAAQELLDDGSEPSPAVMGGHGTRRYVMPAPNGQPLALLAEFVVARDTSAELECRVERLMRSFRWQAS